MNRREYTAALVDCYKLEAAGAIAAEVAMLLRENPAEKVKLDVVRRLEATNKILCGNALRREGFDQPKVESSFYRVGFRLGQRWSEGSWNEFLERFETTIRPEVFAAYVLHQDGREMAHGYDGVDVDLLRHLLGHEHALGDFLDRERRGDAESTSWMEKLLESEQCVGLVGPDDPVGW